MSDVSPLGECDVYCFWIFALFPGEIAEECDEMVGDIILDCGAVANCINIPKGSAVETEMCICLKSVFVCLGWTKSGRNPLAEGCLRDTCRPQAKSHRKFFCDGLSMLILLSEYDSIRFDLFHP